MKEKLVIVGFGILGIRILEELTTNYPDMFDITILGKENYLGYSRINLASLIHDFNPESLIFHDITWYKSKNISIILNDSLLKIDSTQKLIFTKSRQEIPYDKLILATGANSNIPPLPGVRLKGCYSFRNINDIQNILEQATLYKHVVILGGGLSGLEAAYALSAVGLEVTIIEQKKYILENLVNAKVATLLQEDLEEYGIHFLLEKEVCTIQGENGRVCGIEFINGKKIPTDFIIFNTGIKPAIEYARKSSLEFNRGIIINSNFETSLPDVYAIGECAEIHGKTFGSVPPFLEQLKYLINSLTSASSIKYNETKFFGTYLKVGDLRVFSIGNFTSQDVIEIYDSMERNYTKLYFRDNKLIGAILYGNTESADSYAELLNKKIDLSGMTKVNILGSTTQTTDNNILNAKDDYIVCKCNMVSKGTILQAIKTQHCLTVTDIGKVTTAGTTCGACQSKIQELIDSCK